MDKPIIITENTQLNYHVLCTLESEQKNISFSFHIKRFATLQLELFIAHTDASVVIECILEDESSYAMIKGIYIAHQTNNIIVKTVQHHKAAHTKSDIMIKGVLYDTAQTSYDGMIRVEKNAHETHASQENKNILLSKNARAVSVPQIEVLANDVRCFHGSAVGTFDQEQLFYLQSRGIVQECATQLLLKGFFSDMLSSSMMQKAFEDYI